MKDFINILRSGLSTETNALYTDDELLSTYEAWMTDSEFDGDFSDYVLD